MDELFLIELGGQQYGIWKDEILSVEDFKTLHRLPLSPACIAGISVINDRTVTVADLPVCIGRAPEAGNNTNSRILILECQDKLTGFIVSGDIASLSVPPDSVFPMPEYLKTIVIHSCALHENIPVPVIDISAVHRQLLKADNEQARAAFTIPDGKPLNTEEVTHVRIFAINGELYAASSKGFEDQSTAAGPGAQLSLVPRYVRGIVFSGGEILPLIDLAQRIQRQTMQNNGLMLTAEIGGEKFGILVTEDRGTLSYDDFKVRDLSPITRCSWLKAALLHAGEIIPLLDLAALLSPEKEPAAETRLEDQYLPDSPFPSRFMSEDVDVLEFSLLGARHALPKCEVEDILSCKPWRHIPEVPGIIVGVAEHDGDLVPVLDLAMMFGRRSIITPEWSMILIRNGDFRALVVAQAVFTERRLPRDLQRIVPVLLPHRVLYGCYPDADTVRLIVNVQSMAVYFEKSLVDQMAPAFSAEMRTDTADLEPSLHDKAMAAPVLKEIKLIGILPEQVVAANTIVNAGTEVQTAAGDGTLLRTEEPTAPMEQSVQTQEEIAAPALPQGQTEVLTQAVEKEERSGSVSDMIVPPVPEVEVRALQAIDGTPSEKEGSEAARLEETAPVSEDTVRIETAQVEEADIQVAAVDDQAGVSEPEEAPVEIVEGPVIEAAFPGAVPEEVTPSAKEEKESVFESQSETHSRPEPQSGPAIAAYHGSAAQSSDRGSKRRIIYGMAAAVTALLLYFIATFNSIEKPVKQTALTQVEPVTTEVKVLRVAEKIPQPKLVLEVPAQRAIGTDVYVVVKGDTLWSISARFTGSPFNYPRIAGENRIADPDLIFPGQKIHLQKNIN